MTGGAGNDEMEGAQAKKPKEFLTAAEKEREELGKEGQGKWRSSDVNGVWTAITDKEFLGISTVFIKNSNEMRFDYYRTTSGELYDSVTLFRDHSKFFSKV